MNADALRALLNAVATGKQSPEDALSTLQDPRAGYVDLGFARVDLDRARRRGIPEVIFGPGKTADHIARIARTLFDAGQQVLATRVPPPIAAAVVAALADLPVVHDAEAGCLYVQTAWPEDRGVGTVLVVSAGTSDRPVAAEAALVARLCGNRVETLDDVGVAGLHRLLASVDRLRAAQVLIVVAGMEGALPSVVAGLVDRPVIGVPTSVGYGANFGGVSALLGMLNGCAGGLTVVNIDNGFGAAYAATLINRR